jgi:hypothetical protein
MGVGLSDYYARADAVYAAEVVSIDSQGAKANLRVLEVFKGSPKPTPIVQDPMHLTSCAHGFGGIGHRFVLFVDAESNVGPCNGDVWLQKDGNVVQQTELFTKLRALRHANTKDK